MTTYEDTDEEWHCEKCGYTGKGWKKQYERMTVESVEIFMVCPKCKQIS